MRFLEKVTEETLHLAACWSSSAGFSCRRDLPGHQVRAPVHLVSHCCYTLAVSANCTATYFLSNIPAGVKDICMGIFEKIQHRDWVEEGKVRMS